MLSTSFLDSRHFGAAGTVAARLRCVLATGLIGAGGISVVEVATMRFAGNFHPEWGYLAPAPSFMRTARVAVVAMAVGATAGAGAVLSLIDRPAETSVAARTLVRPVEAIVPTMVSRSPTPLAQAPSEKRPAVPAVVVASAPVESPFGSESSRGAMVQAPAANAAIEAPAASDDGLARAAAELQPTPTPAPAADAWAARKKARAKRSISRDSWRDDSWRDDSRRDDTWRSGPLAILPGEYAMRGASRWADRDAWGGYDRERYRYR
jgi:hypothetical protein